MCHADRPFRVILSRLTVSRLLHMVVFYVEFSQPLFAKYGKQGLPMVALHDGDPWLQLMEMYSSCLTPLPSHRAQVPPSSAQKQPPTSSKPIDPECSTP